MAVSTSPVTGCQHLDNARCEANKFSTEAERSSVIARTQAWLWLHKCVQAPCSRHTVNASTVASTTIHERYKRKPNGLAT